MPLLRSLAAQKKVSNIQRDYNIKRAKINFQKINDGTIGNINYRGNTETVDLNQMIEADRLAGGYQPTEGDSNAPEWSNLLAVSFDSLSEEMKDIVNQLFSYGLSVTDINRILSGEITVEELLLEIDAETDQARRRSILEASYFQMIGMDYISVEDLQKDIQKAQESIQSLKAEYEKMNTNDTKNYLNALERLKKGETFEAIAQTVVAWRYKDEQGNIAYIYKDPQEDADRRSGMYIPVTFEMLYQGTNEYQSIHDVQANNIDSYIERMKAEYQSNLEKFTSLQNQIKELENTVYEYTELATAITNNVDYQMNYVDRFQHIPDFDQHTYYDSSVEDTLEQLKIKADTSNYDSERGVTLEISDQKTLVEVLSAIINRDDGIIGNTIMKDNQRIRLTSADDLLMNFVNWLPHMEASEVDIFNYIYNTEGSEAAYNYLEILADQLDQRWVEAKKAEDIKFATEHGFLASVATVLGAPIEGMSALAFSLSEVGTEHGIRRTNVYESSSIIRGQVAQNIAGKNGALAGAGSYLYNIGMSMADSVTLIAASILTGGTSATASVAAKATTGVLSASLMGSRVYGSTLNEALDRGLSDSQAICLASSSALIESAMENYSVGHLLQLEDVLTEGGVSAIEKIVSKITDGEQKKSAIALLGVLSNTLSQGLTEGEEELCTEVLNSIFDYAIAGELSNQQLKIKEYMTEYGKTEEEATSLAAKDLLMQCGEAALGGLISGVGFGFLGSTTSAVVRKVSDTKLAAKNILHDFNTSAQNILSEERSKQLDSEFMNASANLQLNEGLSIDFPELKTIEDIKNKYYEIMDQAEERNKLAKDILSINEQTLPDGYHSIEEFQNEFLESILQDENSNKINNLHLYELASSKNTFEYLSKAGMLTNFFEKNFCSIEAATLMGYGSQESINSILETETVKNVINEKVAASTLGALLAHVRKDAEFSWIGSDVLVNRVEQMSEAELFDFMRRYPSNNLKESSPATIDNFVSLAQNLSEKYLNFDTYKNNSHLFNFLFSFIDSQKKLRIDSRIYQLIKEINDKKASVLQIKSQKYENTFNEFMQRDQYNNFNINGGIGIYDLTYELDGNEYTKSIALGEKVTFGNLSEYFAVSTSTLEAAILNDSFQIKSFNKNEQMSKFVFSGRSNQTYKIILETNGVIKEIEVKPNKFGIIDLSNQINDLENTKVQAIENIDNHELIFEKPGIYKCTYMLNGVEKSDFIKTTDIGKTFSYSLSNIAGPENIDLITNLSVSEATNDQLIDEIKKGGKVLPNDNFLLKENWYGGDQSDVHYVLASYLQGNEMGSIWKQKAESINQIIENYYSGLSDVQKIALVRRYAGSGCGYMAFANAIALELQKRGTIQEVSQAFGYNMEVSDGNQISANVETLALNLFLQQQAVVNQLDIETLINGTESLGTNFSIMQDIAKFLKSKGLNIQVDYQNLSEGNMKQDLLYLLAKNSGFNILCANHFDLEYRGGAPIQVDNVDAALNNSSIEDSIYKNIGSHAMLITDVDTDGNAIVSSWSQKHEFVIDSIKEYNKTNNDSKGKAYVLHVTFDTDASISPIDDAYIPEIMDTVSSINPGENSQKFSLRKFIQDNWYNSLRFQSEMDIAKYFNDPYQYMRKKLEAYAQTDLECKNFLARINQNYGVSKNSRIKEYSGVQICQFLYKKGLLTQEEISFWNNNIYQISDLSQSEKEMIEIFTAHAGPLISALKRKAKVNFGGTIVDGTNINALQSSFDACIEDYNKKNGTNLKPMPLITFEYIMDNMVENHTLKENMTLYRGVDSICLNGKLFSNKEEILKVFRPGTVIHEDALMSTSVVKTSMVEKHNIVLKILAPKGSHGLYLETNSWLGKDYAQQEMLLKSGADLEVVGVPLYNNTTGKIEITVKLKETGPLKYSKYRYYPYESTETYNQLYGIKDGIGCKEILDYLDANDLLNRFNSEVDDMRISRLYDGQMPLAEHDLTHVKNVLLYSMFMGKQLGLTRGEMNILIEAAKYHDSGLVGALEHRNHGEYSTIKIDERLKNRYFESDLNRIKAIVQYHEWNDSEEGFLKCCNQFNITNPAEIDSLKKLANILKDADALDRTRFPGNLNPKYLRNQIAKDMQRGAYQVREAIATNELKAKIWNRQISPQVLNEISGYLNNQKIPRQIILFAVKYSHNYRYPTVSQHIDALLRGVK